MLKSRSSLMAVTSQTNLHVRLQQLRSRNTTAVEATGETKGSPSTTDLCLMPETPILCLRHVSIGGTSVNIFIIRAHQTHVSRTPAVTQHFSSGGSPIFSARRAVF